MSDILFFASFASLRELSLAGDLLAKHVPNKHGVADDIPPPHAPWLFYQAVQPLKSMFLPPLWRTLGVTCKEIEYSAENIQTEVNEKDNRLVIKLSKNLKGIIQK